MKRYTCDECSEIMQVPEVRLQGLRSAARAGEGMTFAAQADKHFCSAECFWWWAVAHNPAFKSPKTRKLG